MSHRSPDTASLSLPPIRNRASSTSTSTNISSALGRRKSALFCLTNPGANIPAQPTLVSQQTDPLPSLIPPSTNPSMLMIFVSRFLEWVHVQPKHSLAWSTPTTPLSAPGDNLLPVSTPTHKTEFGDLSEKDSSASWWSNLPPVRPLQLPGFHPLTPFRAFPDACTFVVCSASFPSIYCSCFLLSVHSSYISLVAPDPHRPRSARPRASRIFAERACSHGTCHRRYVYYCSVQTCLVNSRKRHLGAFCLHHVFPAN